MSHPFGDLITRYRARKHGLSQNRIAELSDVSPAVLTKMCRGRRLTGKTVREKVCRIIDVLNDEVGLTQSEANALMAAAGMSALNRQVKHEARLLQKLASDRQTAVAPHASGVIAAAQPVPGAEKSAASPSRSVIWGVALLLVVLIGLMTQRSMQRRIPFASSNIVLQEITAELDNVGDGRFVVREADPEKAFGKVESKVIRLPSNANPTLLVSATAVDASSSYTIQLQNALDTDATEDVLAGIIAPGFHTIPLAPHLDSLFDGEEAVFTVNIWVSGEGKAVTFDQVELVE